MVKKGDIFSFGRRITAIKLLTPAVGGHRWLVPAEGQPFDQAVLRETEVIFPDELFVVVEAYKGVNGAWVVVAESMEQTQWWVSFMQYREKEEPWEPECDPNNPLFVEVKLEREAEAQEDTNE